MGRLFVILISIGVTLSLIGIFFLFFRENHTYIWEDVATNGTGIEAIRQEYDATQKALVQAEAEASQEMVKIIETQNIQSCRLLKFPEMKAECEDRIRMAEIFDSGSTLEACSILSDATRKQDCQNGIIMQNAVTAKNTDICHTIVADTVLEAQCVTHIEGTLYTAMTQSWALTASDCSSFTDSGVQTQCLGKIQTTEESILFRKVVEGSSTGACNMLQNEKNRNSCKDIVWFRLAMEEYNTTYCSNILDSDQKELCESNLLSYQTEQIMQEALETDTMDACEKLDTPRRLVCRENVLMQRVRTTRDPALCADFTTERLRDICKEITVY